MDGIFNIWKFSLIVEYVPGYVIHMILLLDTSIIVVSDCIERKGAWKDLKGFIGCLMSNG